MRGRKIRFDFQQKILSRLVSRRRQILKSVRINGTKTKKKAIWRDKENVAPSEEVGSDEGDFDQDIDSPSPEKTRSNLSGRIVKDKRITFL